MMPIIYLLSIWCFADPIWHRTLARLEKMPGDYLSHSLQRAGNQTFELETFISTEGDLDSAQTILTEYSNYRHWVLNNINARPGGGEFFVKVVDIIPLDSNQITISFKISVGSFEYLSKRTFQMNTTRLKDRFILEGIAIEDPLSLVSNASGSLTVLDPKHNSGRVWVYIKGHARVSSKLLYSLLPDRAVNNEAGLRVKKAVENYTDWTISGRGGLQNSSNRIKPP